jgi:RNA polymerase sigma-70 factor (ECF subfamily)
MTQIQTAKVAMIDSVDRGNHSPLNTLVAQSYVALKQQMIGYLHSRLKNKHLAEDIFQDAFVKALSQSEGVDIKNIQAWLKRVMNNQMLDYFRRQKQGIANFCEHSSDDIADIQDEIDLEVHHLFTHCLKPFAELLPSTYSQVVLLKDFEGQTIKDIAKAMNLSESAVKSRLSRGRAHLKDALINCCEIELNNGIVTDFITRNR